MKRTILLFLAILLNIFFAFSQVTIGTNSAPPIGALLNLSEGVTTTKGLGLPRVKLTDMKDITKDIQGTTPANTIDHTGLVVYNTNECLFPAGKGIYVWSGDQWQFLEQISPEVFTDTDQDGNTFYYRRFISKDGATDAGYWMLNNLNVKKYANGTPLKIWDISLYGANYHTDLQNPSARYCYPGWSAIIPQMDTQHSRWRPEYGLLYTWPAAVSVAKAGLDGNNFKYDESEGQNGTPNPIPANIEQIGVQGICPNGWHVPSDVEWNKLEAVIYNDPATYSTYTAAEIAAFNPSTWQPSFNYGFRRSSSNTTVGHSIAMLIPCNTLSEFIDLKGRSKSVIQGGFNANAIGYVDGDNGLAIGQTAIFHTSSSSGDSGSSFPLHYTAMIRNLRHYEYDVLRTRYSRSDYMAVRCKKD